MNSALLKLQIGPVQEFIAAGRSTSDLWAGSHFLSTLAWQAMQVIAAAFIYADTHKRPLILQAPSDALVQTAALLGISATIGLKVEDNSFY